MPKRMKDTKVMKTFMAISKGKESTEGGMFKRFIGVGSCYVKAINPTKEEMEKLYNTTLEKAPEYVGEVENRETGAKIPNVRLNFVVQPDPEKYGDVGLQSHTMFLRKEVRYNKDKTKVQVIDKYGRTAWVTIEQAKNHEIPMYSNGPANLDKDYRPAYVGEEDLTNFLINYLNIPSPMKFNRNDRTWYMVDDPSESECRLDCIDKYFKGDFSELRDALNLQPNNKVKICFTVRTAEDGKQYQGTYVRMTLRNSVSDYSKLDADIQEMRNSSTSSSVANTEYRTCEFQEYKVEASTFTPDSSGDMPFYTTDLADSPFGI